MHVQLIGEDNGSGISRDISLLSAALEANGCTVSVRSCGKPERRRRRSVLLQWQLRAQLRHPRRKSEPFDVNVMLEHVWPQFFREARQNVVVPNPEWFDPRDLRYLKMLDCVWAKTLVAERLFRDRSCPTALIGFDSEDRAQTGVRPMHRFLHIAGRSPLKGTARLLALWRRHPEWPTLTVVQDANRRGGLTRSPPSTTNVSLQARYLSDAVLREMQNAHRFHVCTSEAEGWGHYIAEAMSVGAVTLTCDAAPMNELITPERGLSIAASPGPMHNLARLALFHEDALEAAVHFTADLRPAQLESIGAAARSWFLQNKAAFSARVGQALSHLQTPGTH